MLLDYMQIIKTQLLLSSAQVQCVNQCKRPHPESEPPGPGFLFLLDRNEFSPFLVSLVSKFLPSRTYQQQGGHVFLP